MLLYVFTSIIILLFLIKLYYRSQSGICRCENRLDGKLVIVTGANTGIGYETAKDLAVRGARVILACRDSDRGKKAASDIVKETGKTVQFKHLDLASLKSVREFAADLVARERSVDVLINNAGVGRLNNALTEDGIVVEAQVNHFGPFLLTNLLLPLLKNSHQGRIINVSSVMHKFGKVDLEALTKVASNRISHQRVYSNTKLCNLLFTLELNRRLAGTAVTVNSLHPGGVNTDIYRNQILPLRILTKSLMPKTPRDGAQTSIHLVVSPELQNVSGKYFVDCKISEPSKSALDSVLATKLWEFSKKIVQLNE